MNAAAFGFGSGGGGPGRGRRGEGTRRFWGAAVLGQESSENYGRGVRNAGAGLRKEAGLMLCCAQLSVRRRSKCASAAFSPQSQSPRPLAFGLSPGIIDFGPN